MRPLKLVAIAFLFCLLAATFLVYVYPRYYILNGSRNGTDIAEEIIANKRSPAECSHVLDFDPFPSPSADEQSRLCIFTYAKLTQDPSICELLMPSEYGFYCIGAAGTEKRLCTVDFGRIVEWGSYLDGTRQKATLEDCVSGKVPPGLGQQCCVISKVANLQGFDDCSTLSGNIALHEECLSQLALKTGNVETCGPITETGSRIACSLRAKYKSALRTLSPPIDVKTLKSD